MEPFVRLTGRAVPLMRPNVDTDALIPSREIRHVAKTGLSGGLLANWRYSDVERRIENPDFVLNQTRYAGAAILLSGPNFGCGSSREHAVWALREYGIRCVAAPSFGGIFHRNCISNGVLPVTLPEAHVQALADVVGAHDPELTVDLQACVITDRLGRRWSFEVPEADREMLLEGLDAIGVTLKRLDQIRAFEARYRPARPWLCRGARESVA